MPPSRRSRTRAAARLAFAAGEVAVALGEPSSAAFGVAAVAEEPPEPPGWAGPVRADSATAPPAPRITTVTSPAVTYRVLRRRVKCCVGAFIPASVGGQSGIPARQSWEQPGNAPSIPCSTYAPAPGRRAGRAR